MFTYNNWMFKNRLLSVGMMFISSIASSQVILEPDNPFRHECKEIAKQVFANCTNVAGGTTKNCKRQRNQTRIDCQSLLQGSGVKSDDTRANVVRVSEQGTFTPDDLTIKSGDTVVWIFAERTDTIIPIVPTKKLPVDPRTGDVLGATCQMHRPYLANDVNEFTGPLPHAPSGIFLLNSNEPPYGIKDNLWPEPGFTGEFIRLPWKHVHLGPDQFDWTDLDSQMNMAVRNGKLFSITIKAGRSGTPDWIFDHDILGASAVKKLRLRDAGSHVSSNSCGSGMELGSPSDPNYRNQYFSMLKVLTAHIKSRNSWYRALAYVKPSGTNLHSAENRLPVRCWSPTGSGATNDECNCKPRKPGEEATNDTCICNPQVLAMAGYTPAALREFYSLQTALLARELPDKDMSYMLIQAGFPRINNAGEYEGKELVNSLGEYNYPPDPTLAPNYPLVRSVDQLYAILEDGAHEHGARFLVQHNGLKMKPQFYGAPGCSQENHHPVTLDLIDRGDSCPNPHVLTTAAHYGSITGYQTMNFQVIDKTAKLRSTLQNAFDNTDSVFIELYESMFSRGKDKLDFPSWEEKFHKRRRDDHFREKAPDPFPYIHAHRFYYTKSPSGNEQVIRYVHGSKCNPERPQIGTIRVSPN